MEERYGGWLDTHLVTANTFGVGSLFKESTVPGQALLQKIIPMEICSINMLRQAFLPNKKVLKDFSGVPYTSR